ncbi:MAG: ferredoxin family protein [Ignavibacteria bacterium]|nr:ferredoxin family protein [Ignavibacteria bacterium]
MQRNISREFARRGITNLTKYILINTHNCKACWKCFEQCPRRVFGKESRFFGLHKHVIVVSSENCIGCGKCIKECPHKCIYKNFLAAQL